MHRPLSKRTIFFRDKHAMEALLIKAITYARREIKAARFPCINIYEVCAEFHLADSDWTLFRDQPFKTKAAAQCARSDIIERATRGK